jgi:hypothetical protein
MMLMASNNAVASPVAEVRNSRRPEEFVGVKMMLRKWYEFVPATGIDGMLSISAPPEPHSRPSVLPGVCCNETAASILVGGQAMISCEMPPLPW